MWSLLHCCTALGCEQGREQTVVLFSVAAVKNWPEPTDLKSLRSFLGFCGYYRRFIASYSTIVRPLTELMKGYPPTQRQNRNKVKDPKKIYLKPSEPSKDRWDESCRKAFREIVDCLTNAPVLAFADPHQALYAACRCWHAWFRCRTKPRVP